MHIYEVMIIKLFKKPLYFISLALLFGFFFGYYVPETLSKSVMFSGIVEQSRNVTSYIFLGFMSIAALTTLNSCFRIWQWSQLEGDLCDRCCGITELRNGRYGDYYKCLACGKGKSRF